MNFNNMSKTVKTKNIGEPYKFEHEGGHFGTKGSLRGSGRIRKRIVLGEKFDYGEISKEKQNYVLYVSGQGQEKTEIEEMEQIYGVPKRQEKIVEEKQIIDNYQYHETKDIRKNKNKNSQTHHQRLCSPFERTKLVKYSSYTSEPVQNGYKIIKTTDLVNKKDYSRDNGLKKNINNSNISKTYKGYKYNNAADKENSNPNKVYETYVPQKKTNKNSTHIIKGLKRSTSFGGYNISKNSFSNNTSVNGLKKAENIQINYKQPKEVFIPQNIVNYEFKENKILHKNPSYTYRRKIETQTEDYKYKVKASTFDSKKINTKMSTSTNRIKYGSQIRPEKQLEEGPKYQLMGKERPKSGNNISRRRPLPFPKQRQNNNIKKGYIPFGGHGTRVGQGPLGQIPRPALPKSLRDNLYEKKEEKKEKEYHEKKIEKNISFTKIIETKKTSSSNNNIKGINDYKDYIENGSSKKMRTNKSYSNYSNYNIQKKVNIDSLKFPGKGTRVGGSKCSTYNAGLSYESGPHINYTENNIKELNTCETENTVNEKCKGDSFCYNGKQNQEYKEIICPVHGRQLVRMSFYKKLMNQSTD